MKIKEIVAIYKTLGEAKVTKLEESEVIKVVKVRKAVRQYAEEYEAFLKDVQEKFKPDNWDTVQENLQKWQQEGDNTTLTDEQKIEVNKTIIEYQRKIDAAIKEELNRTIDITFDKLKEDSLTKLMIENSWEVKKLDDLDALV